MKNVKDVLRSLEKLGYTIDYSGGGSLAKIYHPDKTNHFILFMLAKEGYILFDDLLRKIGI